MIPHTILIGARRAACRARSLAAADAYLRRKSFGVYGVESVPLPDGGRFNYVNTGDTYENTIGFLNGRYIIANWGDVVERAERRYQAETRTIQCGYCSHFTPKNRRDWRDVVCESCGHAVAG